MIFPLVWKATKIRLTPVTLTLPALINRGEKWLLKGQPTVERGFSHYSEFQACMQINKLTEQTAPKHYLESVSS